MLVEDRIYCVGKREGKDTIVDVRGRVGREVILFWVRRVFLGLIGCWWFIFTIIFCFYSDFSK